MSGVPRLVNLERAFVAAYFGGDSSANKWRDVGGLLANHWNMGLYFAASGCHRVGLL
jgi:hypothetical protein